MAGQVHKRSHYVAGCRHPDCLAANAAYIASWRERKRPQVVPKDKTPFDAALDLIEASGAMNEPAIADVKGIVLDVPGLCIPWPGSLNREGYGQTGSAIEGDRMAHRIIYARFNGPIPDGLTVDHMCFNRACVNPRHLRLLTGSDNSRYRRPRPPRKLKALCGNGHEYTPENTYRLRNRRMCRECNRLAARRYAERKATA